MTNGIFIENALASTVYKDWFRVGQERGGFFPLVDFQMGNNLVSVKSADTNGSTWFGRAQQDILNLATTGATVNGNPATLIFDLRVQPGGSAAAGPLISYGAQF